MRTCTLTRSDRRPGFTLVEMLVVLALILFVTAIAVTFVPSMLERARATKGADQLQGWLLIAKQRALRDRLRTGIRIQPARLYPTPANPNVAWRHDLQYIQQPEHF